LNKLGFNFFYRNELKNNTPFLKERLERYIWSISQVDQKSSTPSFKKTKEGDKSNEEDDKNEGKNICKVEKKKVFVDEKLLFANKETFLKFIQNEADKEYKSKESAKQTDLKIINFNGAVILPVIKVEPTFLSSGLDWSF